MIILQLFSMWYHKGTFGAEKNDLEYQMINFTAVTLKRDIGQIWLRVSMTSSWIDEYNAG